MHASELWGSKVYDMMEGLLKFLQVHLYVPSTCSSAAFRGELG